MMLLRSFFYITLFSSLSHFPVSYTVTPHDDLFHAISLARTHEQYEKTVALLQKGCFLFPDTISFTFQLGNTLCALGMIDHAIACYHHALLKTADSHIPIAYNIGYALKTAGRLDDAITIFNAILTHDPSYASAHLARACTYFMKNEYKQGYAYNEWNVKHQGKFSEIIRQCACNNSFHGKRICLIPEGGYGDTINFFRYAYFLHNQGAYVIARVQPALFPLLSHCTGIDLIEIADGSPITCHGHASYMSVPTLVQNMSDSIPTDIPYIFASPSLSQIWKEKIHNDDPTGIKYKIGIAWQPSITHDTSRPPVERRGIPLKLFRKFADCPDIIWYSLQRESGTEQIPAIADVMHFVPCSTSFDRDNGSFMDTAALIDNLDLVIATDSATMHIAAAMGRTVFLLLPYTADWRWPAHDPHPVWYPNVTIFKQKKPFDWLPVINELYDAVITWMNNNPRHTQ